MINEDVYSVLYCSVPQIGGGGGDRDVGRGHAERERKNDVKIVRECNDVYCDTFILEQSIV